MWVLAGISTFALAAVLVNAAGYPALFGATAIVAAAGSVFVWKIKSVP